MIVFITSDLMMASNAQAHAKQQGAKMVQVSSAEQGLATVRESRPHLLLVDLQCPGLDIKSLGVSLGKLADAISPLTIGFAQHVEVEKLQTAKDAGFDQVLTRGQMNSQVGQIIAGAI